MISVDIDLHIHSSYSFDGFMPPERIVGLARRNGLSGVAITDHNTVAGGIEAATSSRSDGFLVIVGTEVETEVGDIVGLFLDREVRSRKSFEVVDEIHEQGGLALLPHPYSHHKDLPCELLHRCDAVELQNGRIARDYSLRAHSEIAARYDLAATGGSDAHLPWEIGRACTRAWVIHLDTGSLVKALKDHRCEPVRVKQGHSRIAILLSKAVKRLRRLR